MNLKTRKHLESLLTDIANGRDLKLSSGAISAVGTILNKSDSIPANRIKTAEKAMWTLFEATLASKKQRMVGSESEYIRSADIYAGLRSICPLWPFC